MNDNLTLNLVVKYNVLYLFILQFRDKKKKRKTEDLDEDTIPTSTEKKAKLGKKKLVYGGKFGEVCWSKGHARGHRA